MSRGYFIVVGQAVAQRFLSTLKDYPPRQKPASFNLDQVIRKMGAPQGD